jgi:hypothetical protein
MLEGALNKVSLVVTCKAMRADPPFSGEQTSGHSGEDRGC